jgi:hypothetical protein
MFLKTIIYKYTKKFYAGKKRSNIFVVSLREYFSTENVGYF